MNDKKFIQLLNLYIDGEAAPADAVQVEHEIENNPARRRIYQDYTRIQTATRAIYDQFRASAESTQIQIDHGTTVAFSQPGRKLGHPFRQASLWVGGAAAACMAAALAFWSLPQANRAQLPNQVAEETGVSVKTIEPAAVAATAPAADSSYTAPFAMQAGPDPYVRFGGKETDPFSLAPSPRQADFGDPALVLTNVPAFEPVHFAPALWPVDPERVAEDNRKLQAILRGGSEARDNAQSPGGFVPVNFRIEP